MKIEYFFIFYKGKNVSIRMKIEYFFKGKNVSVPTIENIVFCFVILWPANRKCIRLIA